MTLNPHQSSSNIDNGLKLMFFLLNMAFL